MLSSPALRPQVACASRHTGRASSSAKRATRSAPPGRETCRRSSAHAGFGEQDTKVKGQRFPMSALVLRRISPKPRSGAAQRPRSRTWKRAGRIFVRGKRVCTHHMHTSTHRPPTGSPWDGVPGGVLVDSKVRALGPHVAVRDSPYPVAHPACLAGVDGRHRKRHRRDQDPSRPRRVLQMVWLGTSCGRRCVVLSFGGGAMTLVVCFTMVLVRSCGNNPPPSTVADRVPLGV